MTEKEEGKQKELQVIKLYFSGISSALCLPLLGAVPNWWPWGRLHLPESNTTGKQHSTESAQVTGHSKIHTAQCKTRQRDHKRAQTSQAIGHDSSFSVEMFPNVAGVERCFYSNWQAEMSEDKQNITTAFYRWFIFVLLKSKNELCEKNNLEVQDKSVTQGSMDTHSWVSTQTQLILNLFGSVQLKQKCESCQTNGKANSVVFAVHWRHWV